jgi:hypothetical protein
VLSFTTCFAAEVFAAQRELLFCGVEINTGQVRMAPRVEPESEIRVPPPKRIDFAPIEGETRRPCLDPEPVDDFGEDARAWVETRSEQM